MTKPRRKAREYMEPSIGKKISISVALFGLAIASLSFLPATPRFAHAQFTGLVCLSSVTGSCPSSTPTFSGSVGNQIVVNVVIQGSATFNGFDIAVKADPAAITPISISDAGNVFSGCIFPTCDIFRAVMYVNSTTGIVRFAEAAGLLTTAPTTGLLFSITYKIAGSTTGAQISFPVAAMVPIGCSTGSSVAGTTICVAIGNGALPTGQQVVPETVQGAMFVTTPGFTFAASASSLSISRGSAGSITLTIAGTGGFSGTVNLSTVISPVVKHGPSATPNPTTVTLSGSTTVGVSVLTVSALHSTPIASYSITVTASSGTISHSVTIRVSIT